MQPPRGTIEDLFMIGVTKSQVRSCDAGVYRGGVLEPGVAGISWADLASCEIQDAVTSSLEVCVELPCHLRTRDRAVCRHSIGTGGHRRRTLTLDWTRPSQGSS